MALRNRFVLGLKVTNTKANRAPLASDPSSVSFYKTIIQKLMHRLGSPRAVSYLVQRISIAIKKENVVSSPNTLSRDTISSISMPYPRIKEYLGLNL